MKTAMAISDILKSSSVHFHAALEDVLREQDARNPYSFEKLGPDAAWLVLPDHLAIRPDAFFHECQDILHADDTLIHSRDFRNVGHTPATVAHSRDLDHDGNCRRHLLPDCTLRQVDVGHGDHGFQAGKRIAAGIGMDGGHRALVAGVHGLQHVESFL